MNTGWDDENWRSKRVAKGTEKATAIEEWAVWTEDIYVLLVTFANCNLGLKTVANQNTEKPTLFETAKTKVQFEIKYAKQNKQSYLIADYTPTLL